MRWRTANKNRRRLARPVWVSSDLRFADDSFDILPDDLIHFEVTITPHRALNYAKVERNGEMLGPFEMVETNKRYTRRR